VAIKAFEIDYGANYPKAVAKIVDHADVLLEFYRYPAERWIHLRTTNPSNALSRRCVCPPRSPKAPGLTPPVWRWPAVAAGACHP
jgi:putative transposase